MKPPALRRAPGIRQRFRLPYGYFVRMRADPLRFYCEMTREYGDLFRWDIGPMTLHVITHPDHVRHVLVDQAKNYPRSRFTRMVSMVTGNGLVVTEGELWRRQRRLIQPAFRRASLDGFFDLMTRATASMLESWQPNAASGESIDVSEEMVKIALRIVGEALFSMDLTADTGQISESVRIAMEYLDYRFNNVFAPPLLIPTPRNLRFKRALAQSDKLIWDAIRQRHESSQPHCDLLQMLMSARDEETGEAMSDRQVRDEAATFLGAGHETTAMALTWTFTLLSKHPDVRDRLREEVDRVLSGRVPQLADMTQLQLTRRVIEESMRLYPPVWALSKEALAEDEVGGYHIPAGSLILMMQYLTHRMPEFWPNPERFDPDRFLPEAVTRRHRFAYFPFGGGPHLCVGLEFAMQEAIVVLAMTMQRYDVDLLAGHVVVPDPIFTLRPRDRVLARIGKRREL